MIAPVQSTSGNSHRYIQYRNEQRHPNICLVKDTSSFSKSDIPMWWGISQTPGLHLGSNSNLLMLMWLPSLAWMGWGCSAQDPGIKKQKHHRWSFQVYQGSLGVPVSEMCAPIPLHGFERLSALGVKQKQRIYKAARPMKLIFFHLPFILCFHCRLISDSCIFQICIYTGTSFNI